MMKYILMHREIEVAEIELDELSHITNIYEVYAEEHFPVGTLGKHGVDKTMLAKWWAKRSIPASRSGLRETLDLLHMSVPQELLAKCYGLSLSDQYWISPKDKPLMWKEINFFDHDFSEDVGNLLFGYGLLQPCRPAGVINKSCQNMIWFHSFIAPGKALIL